MIAAYRWKAPVRGGNFEYRRFHTRAVDTPSAIAELARYDPLSTRVERAAFGVPSTPMALEGLDLRRPVYKTGMMVRRTRLA